MCIYDQVVITELLLRHTIVIFIVIVTDPSKCVYFPSYFPSVFPFSPSVSPSPPLVLWRDCSPPLSDGAIVSGECELPDFLCCLEEVAGEMLS